MNPKLKRIIFIIAALGLFFFMFTLGLIFVGMAVASVLLFVSYQKVKALFSDKKEEPEKRENEKVIDAEYEILDDD